MVVGIHHETDAGHRINLGSIQHKPARHVESSISPDNPSTSQGGIQIGRSDILEREIPDIDQPSRHIELTCPKRRKLIIRICRTSKSRVQSRAAYSKWSNEWGPQSHIVGGQSDRVIG